MGLDKKDWRILAMLSKDCRISLTRLAKNVGISREVADYRLKKLVKAGIIKSFCAEINLGVLGYTKHVVYLELKNVNKNKEYGIFEILKNNKYVSWIVTSTGKWSLIFDIHSKDTLHLSGLLKELKHDLGNHFGEYQVVTLEGYYYFHSKCFGEKEYAIKKRVKYSELDATDLLILKILRNNARIDYVELSKIVGLTPEAISKRIKKLKESGIIKQFYIFPDFLKLGFEHYNVQINLENAIEEKEKKILKYLENHKQVSFIYKPISHWDIEFGILAENPGRLRDFMIQLRTLYPENIRIRDIALFYQELMPNFLPEGMFSNQPQQILDGLL